MKSFLKFAHFLFVLICVIIQISFIEHLRIFFISIDLILVVVIAVALFDGGVYGIFYGFLAGLLLDLVTSKIVGVNALIYSLIGYLTFKIKELGLKKTILNYIILIFFFSEIDILLYSGIYYLFSLQSSSAKLALEMIINPVCNILIMFLVFPLIKAGTVKKEEIGFVYKD